MVSIALTLAGSAPLTAVEYIPPPTSAPTAETSRSPVVINAGHGGDNTRNLLARVDRDVISAKPSLVILLVGGNDFLNSKNAVPEAQYRSNLLELVTRIKAGGAAVVQLTMSPACDDYLIARHSREYYGSRGPSGAIRRLNEIITEVARETETPLIDLHAAVEAVGGASEKKESLIRNRANSNSEDGIHLTPEGYRLMAKTIFQFLKEHGLNRQAKIVCFGDSLTYGAAMQGAGTAEGDTYPAQLQRLLRSSTSDSR